MLELSPTVETVLARNDPLCIGQPKVGSEIVRALPGNSLLADRRIFSISFEELLGVSPEPGKSGKGGKGMSHDDLLHGIARCPRFGLKVDQSNCRKSADSVDFGLSADTAAPDSAVCQYIRSIYTVQLRNNQFNTRLAVVAVGGAALCCTVSCLTETPAVELEVSFRSGTHKSLQRLQVGDQVGELLGGEVRGKSVRHRRLLHAALLDVAPFQLALHAVGLADQDRVGTLADDEPGDNAAVVHAKVVRLVPLRELRARLQDRLRPARRPCTACRCRPGAAPWASGRRRWCGRRRTTAP